MDVRLPDGTLIRDVPDGMTREQLTQKLAANGYDVSNLVAAPAESFGSKVAQQAGNVLGGAVRGAGSIGATILSPLDAAARALNSGKPVNIGGIDVLGQDRRAGMDAALQTMGADPQSLAFQGGKLGAEIAGTAGVGGTAANLLGRVPGVASTAPNVLNAIRSAGMTTGGQAAPGAVNAAKDMALRMLGGGVTGAATAGVVDPSQAGTGAAIGAALPPAMKAAGAVGGAIGSALRPNIQNPALAQKAIQQYGIPLGPADISASRTTKAARSVLNDAPFTAGIGERQGEAVQSAFNRAVGETFGAPAPKLTPQVIDQAKQRMGAEFDRIWNSNSLEVDQTMLRKLMDLQAVAGKMPKNEGASLTAEIDDLLSKVQTGPNGAPIIPGDIANKFQSYLRRRAEGSAGMKYELGDLRRSIIEAFNRNVSPADAAALTANRGQYKAFKTVEPLLQGAEAGVAGRQIGDVPAGLLPQAVRKSYTSGISGSPFEDLSQIGSQYIADRVARTGGGPRAAIQNSAIGAAIGLGGMQNPLLALAAIPTAVGTQAALGSPRMAQAMLNAGQQNALMQLLLDPMAQAAYRAAPVIGAR